MDEIAEGLNIASELVAVNGPKVRLWSGWANVCARKKPPGCKLNQTNAPLLHPIHATIAVNAQGSQVLQPFCKTHWDWTRELTFLQI